MLLDRVNKKNSDHDGDGEVSVSIEQLSIEYVDTTRFSTKSQRRQMKRTIMYVNFVKGG